MFENGIRPRHAWKRRFLVGSCLTLAAGLAPMVAGASSVPTQPPVVSSPMTNIPVTAVTSAGHGESTVTLADGANLQVPTAVAADLPIAGKEAAASPANTVTGNCGSSYVYLFPDGSTGVSGITGWVVTSPAYYYEWGNEVDNTTINSSTWFEWENSVSGTDWGTNYTMPSGPGFYTAVGVGVYPSLTGYVFTSTGVCASLGARDTQNVS